MGKSQGIKQKIIDLVVQHPYWSGQQIAEVVGCTRAYVSLLGYCRGKPKGGNGKSRSRKLPKYIQTSDWLRQAGCDPIIGDWFVDENGIPTRELRA